MAAWHVGAVRCGSAEKTKKLPKQEIPRREASTNSERIKEIASNVLSCFDARVLCDGARAIVRNPKDPKSEFELHPVMSHYS